MMVKVKVLENFHGLYNDTYTAGDQEPCSGPFHLTPKTSVEYLETLRLRSQLNLG